ncbi:hypothetical protein CTAYLR_004964 [Chrysophaeum taylorii]|uniref:J domain-containing protein n=1 Tax=Chrysophaeum taylorii TaxID=2483200 RepID=A0AAD7UPR9_9STRA|nr:hypothetical protein CTAYLR_004964 [Chrysophaeum taylorii]
MTLYDTLEVNPDATLDELRRSYHRLALRHHPDKGGHGFTNLQRAWELLRDPATRAAYDHSISNQRRIIWRNVPVTALRSEDKGLALDCRCGSLFYLDRDDARSPILVPCDGCSLHIRVYPPGHHQTIV